MTTAPDAPSSTLAPLGTYPVPPPTYKYVRPTPRYPLNETAPADDYDIVGGTPLPP